MSRACSREPELDAWQRRGAGAALPVALEHHLEQCDSCRAQVLEIGALRRWAAKLPAFELEQRRLDEMQFLLMAETRRQPRRQHASAAEAPRSRRWQLPLGYAWVIGSLASVASAFSAAQSRPSDEHATPLAPPSALSAPPAPDGVSSEPELVGTRSPDVDNLHAPSGSKPSPRTRAKARLGPPSGAPRATPPSASATPSAPSVSASDGSFRRAHALLGRGRATEAVLEFDRLAADAALDDARRADALFWAARAARASGDAAGARARAERYLSAYPDGWYAARAAALR